MEQQRASGQSLYGEIRSDIVFGRLEPGEKLKTTDLRSRYGTSVSTLREVLNRLASEGFVEAREQRGFFVAPMSEAGLREIADLRILLENHALEQSLAAGDTNWEAGVISAYHKLERMEKRRAEGDASVIEAWKRYDWEFHQSLIAACGSAELRALHGTVFDKYLRYQMQFLSYRGEVAASEHRGLLDAALAHDAAAAQKMLRAHISGGVEHALSLMRL
ncbi:GntR family transcriptional regulator [Tropicimonas sediminicola]|uniref:Transcriptional regulator, GntR family n=1 Tax=Tropicimonas sediminicola TaxID=1031541 RepID=A0A239LIQ6_9RHOB|nr:GntR family transcriptional regulator [Tropicimonas sediminicola]SNT30476.1 transcriptional regulator, GntR family [Tropicimonas sediminicola]